MFSDDKKNKQKAVLSGAKTTVPQSVASAESATLQSAPGLDLTSGGIMGQSAAIPSLSADQLAQQGVDLATGALSQLAGESGQKIAVAVSQAQQVAETVTGIVGQGANISATQGLDIATDLASQVAGEAGQKVAGAVNQAQQAASMVKNLSNTDLPVMKNRMPSGIAGSAGGPDSSMLMKSAVGSTAGINSLAAGSAQAALSGATGLQFTLTTPNLPDDTFAVASFTHQEAFSSLFDLKVELASKNPAIDFGDVLDENATLTVWRDGIPERSVTGVVSRFKQGDTGFHRTRYTMEIRPALWRTTLRQNSRIFQTETIEQILDTLMKENGRIDCVFAFRHKHPAREFCVQYQESDFDFIQRLTAEEGIYYYFEFEEGKHRVVFTDDASAQSDGVTLPYNLNKNAQIKACCVGAFSLIEQVRPAVVVSKDYTFKNPAWSAEFTQEAKNAEHQRTDYRHFDFPGRFKDEQHGQDFARYRMEALRNDAELGEGASNSFAVYPGERFILTNHPRADLNKNWQVVNIVHTGSQPQALEEEGGEQGTTLTNTFTFMPSKQTWRPAPLPKPKIDGPQIAKVVGPSTEEIWTDKYGRVKLKFLWDQTETEDDSSSCWIRVSQPLAGKGFGMMAIPRIGQEVIVDFLSGDPDQPIVTGRTYHASNMQSLDLPAAKTQTALRSQTHKGAGFNELRFEDEGDKQGFFMHAQKDMTTMVLNNRTTTVMANHTESVVANQGIQVGQNQTIQVLANQGVQVKEKQNTLVGGDQITNVGGGVLIASATGIRLVCGDAVLEMDAETGNISLICNNFNIYAKELGQVTAGTLLDLNMDDAKPGTKTGPSVDQINAAISEAFSGNGGK